MAEDGEAKPKSAKSKTAKKMKVKPPLTQAPQLPAGASDMIGKRLRAYYEEIASEPVPDRFLDLLNELEAKTAPNKSN